jgi:hypothetical protein
MRCHTFFLLFGSILGNKQILEVSLNDALVGEQGLVGTERVAGTWKTILLNSGIDVDIFVVRDGEIVVASPVANKLKKVKEFLKSQDSWVKNLNS